MSEKPSSTPRDGERAQSAPRQANKRGVARLAAVQALYQMDIGAISLEATIGHFAEHLRGGEIEGAQYLPADADYFNQIVKGVVAEQARIDPLVNEALSDEWPVTRVDATLRAILRAATFELIKKQDIPPKVVISEYIDIARAFFEDDVPGMVNAVLDRIARDTQKT